MDYRAIDNLDFDALKKLYDKVPKDKVSTYNIPNWGTDDIGIIRKKLITIYKGLESETVKSVDKQESTTKEETKEVVIKDTKDITEDEMEDNKEDRQSLSDRDKSGTC